MYSICMNRCFATNTRKARWSTVMIPSWCNHGPGVCNIKRLLTFRQQDELDTTTYYIQVASLEHRQIIRRAPTRAQATHWLHYNGFTL